MTSEPTTAVDPRYCPCADFVDPRTREDFEPTHWPLCNGGEAPGIGASDLHERRCIEFLAAYYEYNRRRAAVLAAREDGAARSTIDARLRAVRIAADSLDALQDRYAPVGFDGEPAMNGDFYHDIEFHRAELPHIPGQSLIFSSHIAVPGLEEIPEHELQGPVTITRFSNAKVGA